MPDHPQLNWLQLATVTQNLTEFEPKDILTIYCFIFCDLGQQKQLEPVKYQLRFEYTAFWHLSVLVTLWNWSLHLSLQTSNVNQKRWRCSPSFLSAYPGDLAVTFFCYHVKTAKLDFMSAGSQSGHCSESSEQSNCMEDRRNSIPSYCKGAENVLLFCSSSVGSRVKLKPLSLGPFVLSANLCPLLSKSKSESHYCSVAPLSWTLNGPQQFEKVYFWNNGLLESWKSIVVGCRVSE